ncbi:hypothetical protein CIPAW_06G070900 [Carya illinoinensis]|uniref:Uncharacterized protein n=1 Tax=Carya illinoinensis TaxID=32201 RepID=A0A8T1Q8X4_CARIL|nr:hypothetical protein CIPAW_06G070900 [Carya illinoinensis]
MSLNLLLDPGAGLNLSTDKQSEGKGSRSYSC